MTVADKPRIRIKAPSQTIIPPGAPAFNAPVPALRRAVTGGAQRGPTYGAKWLRDSSSGVLAARNGLYLTDSREEIQRVWDRAATIALDLIQNSGRLKGAVDQVLADTLGNGLKLIPRPDLRALGYSEEETTAFIKLVQERWKLYSENPDEVDFRGKFNLHQLADTGLRNFIAYGEELGVVDFFDKRQRRQYGIQSGTKLLMFEPHRLVQSTDELIGMHSGVIHDPNGRPVAYRFKVRESGWDVDRDYPARDADGRTLVIHCFDPWSASDTRGISVLAASLRTESMAAQLGDATLEAAFLQTVFAASLISPEPNIEAFQAIEQLSAIDSSEDNSLQQEFLDYLAGRLDAARAEGSISLKGAQVNNLAPGEKLEFQTAAAPGNNYLPFSQDLRRELARAIGVTYESFTLDHSNATYSSVRMGNASIWPVVMRRRDRVAAPLYQAVYESWLDEEIGEGRIEVRGGYNAFRANRHALTNAVWQGPPKPSADDGKSAVAATERLANGTSSLEYECTEVGMDWRDVTRQRAIELKEVESLGLPNPFLRVQGGGPQEDDEGKSSPPKKVKK